MKRSSAVLLTISRSAIAPACLAYMYREWHALFLHETVHVFAATVATFVATGLIWMRNKDVRGWTWLAFIVFAVGMMLVTLTLTMWSPVAFAAIAAAAFKLWRLHQRSVLARIVVEGTRVFIPLKMKITAHQVLQSTSRGNSAGEARSGRVAPHEELPAFHEVPAGPTPAPQSPPVRKPNAVRSEQLNTAAWNFGENVRHPSMCGVH